MKGNEHDGILSIDNRFKGCGKEYIGTVDTCGIDGCTHHCGDGSWECEECQEKFANEVNHEVKSE